MAKAVFRARPSHKTAGGKGKIENQAAGKGENRE